MERKEVFQEIENHLMNDEKPSEYFNMAVQTDPWFKESPFDMLRRLVDTPQSPEHHPEGSVWNHTLMVVDHAANIKDLSKNPRVLMWAALLHDIGKGPTTRRRKGKWTSYDHDKWGEKMSMEFLSRFTQDKDFIRSVSQMIRWHMQALFVVKDLPFADIEHMVSQVSIDEISLLVFCDRMGRGAMSREKVQEEQKNIEYFYEKMSEFLSRQKAKV